MSVTTTAVIAASAGEILSSSELLEQYMKIVPAMMNTIRELEQCCYEDDYSSRVEKAIALTEANAELMMRWVRGS